MVIRGCRGKKGNLQARVADTYDDNGNMLTKMDARGVVATSTYDALNRTLSTTFSDGTPSATYSYDQTTSSLIGLIQNGKGRMTSAWTSDGIGYGWTYDIGGRATQQVASVDGVQYALGFSYLDQGCGCAKSDLRQITYPDGYIINYGRDAIGRISSISDSTTTYASYGYGAANGAVSNVTWRNNVSQTFEYDAKGRLSFLRTLQFDGTYGQTVYWNYSYNQNSQVSQISEHVYRNYPEISDQQAQFSYEYDHWGRLAAAGHATYNGSTFVPDQTNSFSYDQFGNMLTNNLTFPSDPQSNWYSSFNVNAADNRLASYTNSQGTTSTTYDAAGNMLTEGSRSYAFDGAGRMTSAGPGAGTYRYDALGQRIKKTYSYQGQSGTISGSIVSIYGPGGELLADYVVENGSSSRTDYILYGSQAIARRSVTQSGSATVQDLYRNHLNQVFDLSTYTVTTGLSTMYGIPFGSGGNDQFSGHKDDPESGLHYNLARSYNPTIARWISPDPIVGNAFDPQSLNKYGYVRNDPVNRIDPDGRMTSELQNLMSMGWSEVDAANLLYALPNINGSNPYWGGMNPSYYMYMMAQNDFNAYQYQLYLFSQLGISTSGNSSGSGYVYVSNVSTSGDDHERIIKVLDYIKNNISSDCGNSLPGVYGLLNDITAHPSSIATAQFDTSIDAFVGGMNTNLPSGIAIAVNSLGLFFNPSLIKDEAGYLGGGIRAQLLILFHELGHLTKAFGANDHDAGDQNKVNANNDYIKQNCGAIINAASVIP